MRVPSQDELLQFMDAGEFTHGALPMSRQRQMEYGVDHDARNWYFNDDSRYGVDANAQYSGIPHTSDLYDGIARTMMTTIASTYNPTINVAKIPGQTGTLMGAADDLARAGNYQSPRLVDKNGRVLKSLDEYKYRPRKRRTTGGPKPPTYPTIDPTVPPVDVSNITRPASPFIDFENLSRWFKKQGGKL